MNSDGGTPFAASAAALEKAAAYPDEAWYRDIARSDPRGCPLAPAEMDAIVKGSIGAAEALAAPILRRFGRDAARLAADLGLAIVREGGNPGFSGEPGILGLWLPGEKRIVLYENSITMVSSFLNDVGLAASFAVGRLGDAIVFHELFHALEDDSPDIFTRSAMLERKFLGLFPYRRGFPGASEIGAVHFSKLMTGLEHSPRIFERCLLLAANRLSPDRAAPQS